jgi:CRISPR-associated protein Csm2
MNQKTNRKPNPRRGEKSEALERIESLARFSELSVKDFAPEGGLAHREAKQYGNRLKTSQLRKFFDAIKDIERGLEDTQFESIQNKFYLLQPKLAYARGRDLVPEDFYRLMNTSMQKINTENPENFREDYERFVRFLEAIVAYHKYETG